MKSKKVLTQFRLWPLLTSQLKGIPGLEKKYCRNYSFSARRLNCVENFFIQHQVSYPYLSRGAQPQACRPSAFRLGVSVSGQYRSVALWLDAVLLLTLLVGKNFLFYSPAPLTIRTAS